MNTLTIGRPAADEHHEYYARYISRVPDGDLIDVLRQQLTETVTALRSVPEGRGDFAYGPGKWSIKKVICHVSDVERVMFYRALTFARNDKTDLPGFDENQWADDFNTRSEERRVGKECRSRGSPDQYKKKEETWESAAI